MDDADIRSSRRCYTFGPFAADCRKRLLWRGATLVPLTPKAFEILATLIEHRGRVLDKDELLHRVWGDVAVEDATLAKHISTLRHALDERPNQHLYVVTVPGRGYEFVANVSEIDDLPAPLPTNHEPRSTNHEPRSTNHEPRSASHESQPTIDAVDPRTTNHDPQSTSHEPRSIALSARSMRGSLLALTVVLTAVTAVAAFLALDFRRGQARV